MLQRKDGLFTMTKLTDNIKTVLTEARVVLPGATALLGFQICDNASGSLRQAARIFQVCSHVEPMADGPKRDPFNDTRSISPHS